MITSVTRIMTSPSLFYINNYNNTYNTYTHDFQLGYNNTNNNNNNYCINNNNNNNRKEIEHGNGNNNNAIYVNIGSKDNNI